MVKIVKLDYDYSSVLFSRFGHSVFFLFANMKKGLEEKRLASLKEVITETNVYFAKFEKSYFWKD